MRSVQPAPVTIAAVDQAVALLTQSRKVVDKAIAEIFRTNSVSKQTLDAIQTEKILTAIFALNDAETLRKSPAKPKGLKRKKRRHVFSLDGCKSQVAFREAKRENGWP